MRITALVAASAAVLALAACNNNEKAAEPSADAAAASEAATDTAATSARESSAEASAAAGSARNAGETVAPAGSITTPTSDAMPPAVQPPAAGANMTDTERRLNPQPNTPAQ